MVCLVVSVGIIGAIAWPATIIAMAGVIDNPWNVCTQRATNAGLHLAEVLLSRQQVNIRPAWSYNKKRTPVTLYQIEGSVVMFKQLLVILNCCRGRDQ